MPITRATYLYACVAISGLPLASGFFSKDELLVGALTARTNLLPGVGPALWAGGLVVALLTSFYMWRSYFLTFSGAYRGGPRPPSESPRAITWVLVALALGTAGVTFLGFWPPLGELLGSDALTHPWLERWLEPSLAPVPEWVRARAAPPSLEAQLVTAVTSVVMALGGWGAAFAFYRNRSQLPEPFARRLRPLRALVQTRFYVDELYGALIVTPTRLLARGFAWVDSVLIDGLVHLVARWTRTLAQADEVFDRVVVDGLVNGLARTLSAAGGRLQRLQTGRLQTYLYAAVAGAVLVLGLNLLLRR